MENIYPYKILFVEDEQSIRENYVTYLKMFFSEVYEAENGEKAYDIYKQKKPDIMIVDINIPKLSGLELLRKIRENDYNTKAIVLTAHTDKTFLLEATSLKLTRYLVKPVSRKDLKEALKDTIDELLKYNILPIQKINLTDDYSWDFQLNELKHHNKNVELTNKEKIFLKLLFSHKNRVFTYDEIFEYIWQYEDSISIDGLKNMVKRLRKKLPENTILNVFNEGYKVDF
jgi:DNA-binding response OmpR family regulator